MNVVFDLATGGDAVAAFNNALIPYAVDHKVTFAECAHDDECPCSSGRAGLTDCTCEIIRVTVNHDGDFLAKPRKRAAA